MKNGDGTEGRNKFVEEWFCGESFITNISSLAQDAPGSQIADDWDSEIALFFKSCPVTWGDTSASTAPWDAVLCFAFFSFISSLYSSHIY